MTQVDPNRTFKIAIHSDHSNSRWNGSNLNGKTAVKGDIIEVNIHMTPNPSAPVNGVTKQMYALFRSADVLLKYDPTKLELVNASANPRSTDKAIIDVSRISATVIDNGIIKFHSRVYPPPQRANFYWEFGGYKLMGGARNLGVVRFRVLDDFYFPTVQTTNIDILPEAQINGAVVKTFVDGSPTPNTNMVDPNMEDNVNRIKFGPRPDYKMKVTMTPPSVVSVGSEFSVPLTIESLTSPQWFSSVTAILIWDPTKIELMGLDKTGAKVAQMSGFLWGCPTCLNETKVPKDGNAQFMFLNQLGNMTPVSQPTLLGTLKFKAVSQFDETAIEVVKMNDPRLAGLSIIDDTGIITGTSASCEEIYGTVIKGWKVP